MDFFRRCCFQSKNTDCKISLLQYNKLNRACVVQMYFYNIILNNNQVNLHSEETIIFIVCNIYVIPIIIV